MSTNLTREQLMKMKETESAEDLLARAKENGIDLTEDAAKRYFEMLHKEGELADEELENVAGGICDSGGYETNLWNDGTYFWNHVGGSGVTKNTKYGFTADNDNGWVIGEVIEIYNSGPLVYKVKIHNAGGKYVSAIGHTDTFENLKWTAYLNAQDSNGRTLCPYND